MQLPRSPRRTRTTKDTRTGTVLVLFAVLVFAVLGIAALTVDVGFASLAQAQMQSSADTAALEGVRLRDYDVYRWRSNLYRRPIVADLVQQTMDDDLHPTRGVSGADAWHPPMDVDDADAFRFGAGPALHLTDGIGETNASALIVVPDGASSDPADQWVDDPKLQSNMRNAPAGDIVSGEFVPYASHAESETYERDDFMPAQPVGFDTTGGFNALGMLVRLRRTTGDNPLDDVEQISSRGNTLPFLFGLGTSIHAAGPGYNPRRDGLTVRAVAIASARPALRIGPPPRQADGSAVPDRRNEPVLGVGYWHEAASGERVWFSIAFSYEGFWRPYVGTTDCEHDTSTGTTAWDLSFDSTGTVRDGGGAIVGHLMREGGCVGDLVPTDLTIGANALSAAEVDQIFAEIRSLTPVPGVQRYAYFPVYRDVTSSTGATSQRVIGFGYGALSFPAPATLRFTFDFDTRDDQRPRTIVAFDNASAALSRRTLPAGLDRQEWDQVFQNVVQFAYPAGTVSGRWQKVRVGTVLAPALTR